MGPAQVDGLALTAAPSCRLRPGNMLSRKRQINDPPNPETRMRIPSVLLSVAVLLNAGVLRADDDTKAIIEKAIKAHGGAEKLSKYKASRMKGKGKVDTPVGELEFTQETAAMLPDKIKEISEFEVMGQKIRTVTLINGDKASIEANGKEVPLKDE